MKALSNTRKRRSSRQVFGLCLALALALTPLAACTGQKQPEGDDAASGPGMGADFNHPTPEDFRAVEREVGRILEQEDFAFDEVYSFEYQGFIVTCAPDKPYPYQDFKQYYPEIEVREEIPGYKLEGVNVATMDKTIGFNLSFTDGPDVPGSEIELGVKRKADMSDLQTLALFYVSVDSPTKYVRLNVSRVYGNQDEAMMLMGLERIDEGLLGSPNFYKMPSLGGGVTMPLSIRYASEGVSVEFSFSGHSLFDVGVEEEIYAWLISLGTDDDLEYYKALLPDPYGMYQ